MRLHPICVAITLVPTLLAAEEAATSIHDPALKAADDATAAPTQSAAEPTIATEQSVIDTPEADAIGILFDINVGTQGAGLSVGYEFNKYLKMRLRGAYLAYDRNEQWGQLNAQNFAYDAKADAKFEFDGNNAGIILDVHPFGGTFRVSGGLNFSNMELKAKTHLKASGNGIAQLANKEYEFGGVTYRALGSEGDINGKYSWNTVQPYLGIGWSSDGDGDRSFYFTADLGVNFIGSGKLKVNASDNIQMKDPMGNWVAVDNSSLEHSVREEGKDFFKVADNLHVYPVLQFGLGYRF